MSEAPYGTWKSPITADLIVSETVGLGDIRLDGDIVHWLESRPGEGGRNVVVRLGPDGERQDLLPPPFNARSRVHEYGGAPYLVAEGVLYFVNFADQHLYQATPDTLPAPLTREEGQRYADLEMDRRRHRILCVREDHRRSGAEPINCLVAVDLAGGTASRILAAGADFYAAPRLSPDGERLAWLSWNHPNMPWDGCELWLGEVAADGSVGAARRIAGGPGEAVCQPRWARDGTLTFISDPGGWWTLHHLIGDRIEAIAPRMADFAKPAWVFGLSTYDRLDDGRIVCGYAERGLWHLAVVDPADGGIAPLASYCDIDSVQARGDRVWLIAGEAEAPAAIVEHDLAGGSRRILRRSTTVSLHPESLSRAEPIAYPSADGRTAHAFFYPPVNRDYTAPPDERPPLIVLSHGGPTSATSGSLSLRTQYWTSRGFAVLDVNYGGSSGYGRAYRECLKGNWGIVDVDDCCNGARFLVEAGRVDGERLVIAGSSAGGFTTLAALTFRDVFKAGRSSYGIGDLEALLQDTHKFEARYLDSLIGPYPAAADRYRERSPIHHCEQLSAPVLFLQGLEDKVVPPSQAETMVAALNMKRIPVAYLAFPGEQHGFRQAATIKRALEAELYFYGRVFGFTPADPIEPLEIKNLD